MNGEWKVKIYEKLGTLGYEVFVFRDIGNKVEVMGKDYTSTILEKADFIPPSFLIESKQMLTAFAEALNNMGVSPSKEYSEGKLEATENHLQDMRTLLKLK